MSPIIYGIRRTIHLNDQIRIIRIEIGLCDFKGNRNHIPAGFVIIENGIYSLGVCSCRLVADIGGKGVLITDLLRHRVADRTCRADRIYDNHMIRIGIVLIAVLILCRTVAVMSGRRMSGFVCYSKGDTSPILGKLIGSKG